MSSNIPPTILPPTLFAAPPQPRPSKRERRNAGMPNLLTRHNTRRNQGAHSRAELLAEANSPTALLAAEVDALVLGLPGAWSADDDEHRSMVKVRFAAGTKKHSSHVVLCEEEGRMCRRAGHGPVDHQFNSVFSAKELVGAALMIAEEGVASVGGALIADLRQFLGDVIRRRHYYK